MRELRCRSVLRCPPGRVAPLPFGVRLVPAQATGWSIPDLRGWARLRRGSRPNLHGLPAVDPRACGVEFEAPPRFMAAKGRSPRVRGYLGMQAACRLRVPVDLRVCGETASIRGSQSPSAGPSPRARGTAVQHVVRNEQLGSIPALAGERRRNPGQPAPDTVNPRAGGETVQVRGLGGTPPARGSRPSLPVHRGSTPARAGKCHRDPALLVGLPPHARGNASLAPMVYPRTRGNSRSGLLVTGPFPARAGRHEDRVCDLDEPEVDPRTRGVRNLLARFS